MTTEFRTCIPDFQVASRPTPLPRLPLTPGSVVWTHVDTFPALQLTDIAVRAGVVAYALGSSLRILHAADGQPVLAPIALGQGGVLSTPSIDADGNVYIASDSLFVTSSTGAPITAIPLGANQSQQQETTIASRPILTPSGDVLVAATDLVVRSIHIGTWAENWRATVPLVAGGIAPVVHHVGGEAIGVTTSAFVPSKNFLVSTGEELGDLFVDSHPLNFGTPGSDGTLTATWFDLSAYRLVSMRLDRCGHRIVPEPSLAGWISETDYFGASRIVIQPSQRALSLVGESSGVVTVGPVTLSGIHTPLIVGADGTIYIHRCSTLSDGGHVGSVVALDSDLSVRWETEVPACDSTVFSLGTDGVLYFGDSGVGAQEVRVVAIQTDSPGPVDFAYPGRDFGAATGW